MQKESLNHVARKLCSASPLHQDMAHSEQMWAQSDFVSMAAEFDIHTANHEETSMVTIWAVEKFVALPQVYEV